MFALDVARSGIDHQRAGSAGRALAGEGFFSSRRRHTRCGRDWSSDVCSSDLPNQSTFTPVNLRAEGVSGEPGSPSMMMGTKPLTDTTLREHFAELRRALVAGV